MSRITLEEARAWGEKTKLDIGELDVHLLNQLEEEILARVGAAYSTAGWTNSTNTPSIVRVAIAKFYVSWLVDRQYSEDEDLNAYAARLAVNAEMLVSGIVDGTIEIPGIDNEVGSGQPSFYPNDDSSAQHPTFDDTSLGPASFSMGQVF